MGGGQTTVTIATELALVTAGAAAIIRMSGGWSYSVLVDSRTLYFEREYELPRAIVWDALVDDVLVSGWLAEADIERVLGGTYVLRWTHREPRLQSTGRIIAMDEPNAIEIEFSDASAPSGIRFDLVSIEGGSRGSSTRLSVRVGVIIDRAFEPRLTADWLTNLDQLEDVLRGHPVDWVEWERDRGPAWSQHLAQSISAAGVENSTA
jgi:uncharacterized protein YndB with AHSA1/START domain